MAIAQEKTCWVHIAASKPHGVLCIGMTSDLAGRTWEHRERAMDGFTQRYWVGSLVSFEAHDDARVAARRERARKRWGRDWKIELIEQDNPTWRDLFGDVVRADGIEWSPLHMTSSGEDPG
jgi:putative endonuclease